MAKKKVKNSDPSSTKSTTRQGRTVCEVFSRIVGYMRPVSQWNDGKAEEFKMRTAYKVN